MKKILLSILIFLNTLLLCSCLAEEEIDEIEDLAFVSTIGIDKASDGKGFLVSVRIIDYRTSESQSGGGNLASGYSVLEADGETVYEAIKNIQPKSRQTIFFGHNKAIILGKSFAKEGINNVIDAFERNTEISGSNKIFISESTANSAIKENIGPSKGSEADFVNAMVNVIKNDTIAMPIMLYQFTLEMKSDNMTSYAPLIRFASKESVDNVKTVNFEETAILKNDKLLTVLNKEQTTSLLWIKSKLKDETLIIPYKNGDNNELVTVEIKNGSSKVKTILNEDKLTVKIDCNGEAYIREISNGNTKHNNSKTMEEITKLINERLKTDLLQSIEFAKKQVHCEYFGIAHAIHNQHPKYWKEIYDQWDQIFQTTPFEVSINTKIKDIGMINEPATAIMDEGEIK